MNTMSLTLLLLAPVVLFALWYVTANVLPPATPANLRNKRVIFLIAHPDDESMFFSPTLQALTHPSLGNHVKVLCLSTGNADGLGETRKKELEEAAVTLGVRRREDVFVMDDARFKDGMKETWDPKEVARVLAQAFAPQLIQTASSSRSRDKEPAKDKKSAKVTSKSSTKARSPGSATNKSSSARREALVDGPRATIDALVTFDSRGISSHPNHIALYHGARLFLQSVMHGHNGYKCPVDLYTLTSINILRKYTFLMDLVPTYVAGIYAQLFGSVKKAKTGLGKDPKENKLLFINDVGQYMKARKAMVRGHKSQMVWFRWGWIGLGRYMVINDLRREYIAHS